MLAVHTRSSGSPPCFSVPAIFCTDCFKLSFSIEFVLESESITLFMETPNREEIQWVATISGKTYLINTNAPMEALELLRPYLREDVIVRLTQEIKGP